MNETGVCPQTGYTCQTLVSLRDHIESKFAAQDKALDLHERALELRLRTLNEYRDQAKAEAARYATLVEVAALREQIDGLRLSRAELAGKAGANQVIVAQMIALAALVASLLGLFMG